MTNHESQELESSQHSSVLMCFLLPLDNSSPDLVLNLIYRESYNKNYFEADFLVFNIIFVRLICVGKCGRNSFIFLGV